MAFREAAVPQLHAMPRVPPGRPAFVANEDEASTDLKLKRARIYYEEARDFYEKAFHLIKNAQTAEGTPAVPPPATPAEPTPPSLVCFGLLWLALGSSGLV